MSDSTPTSDYYTTIYDIPRTDNKISEKDIATIFKILHIDPNMVLENSTFPYHAMLAHDQETLIAAIKKPDGLIKPDGTLTLAGMYVDNKIKEAHQGKLDAAKRFKVAAGLPPRTKNGSTNIRKWVEEKKRKGGKICTRKRKLRGIARKTRKHNKDIFHIFR